ncbi:MAG: hypothetical protein ACYTF3_09685 [Planctomycetota bacterium]
MAGLGALACEGNNPEFGQGASDAGDGGPIADGATDPDAAARCSAGDTCDDGDPCTNDDRCDDDGTCAGQPVVCEAEDACQTGACEDGECVYRAADPEVASEAGLCDDGLDNDCDGTADADDTDCGGECTVAADCPARACEGVAACTDGQCEYRPLEDGTACDDGDACTEGDACTGGACRGDPLDCGAPEDVCSTRRCDPALGRCVDTAVSDGVGCDDRTTCTDGDRCVSGRCVGVPRDCTDLDGACSLGVCTEETGECRAVPRSDGTPCAADDRCVPEGATCQAGACVGEGVDCGDLDGTCRVGRCDPETGGCAVEALTGGEACDDGDPCTTNDRCGADGCTGTPRDCAALDGPCTVGRCDPDAGGCVAESRPNGVVCDDGDACTTDDRCNEGACGGQPVRCEPADDACTVVACNPESGQCEADIAGEGACDDGDPCTVEDTCNGGRCLGAPRDCADDDPCTVDGCGPDGQCQYRVVPRPGEEGAGETCSDGADNDCDGAADEADADCRACIADGDCLDADPCTAHVCREGRCIDVSEDGRTNGAACDDGDGCTAEDRCAAGVCRGEALDCGDLDGPCAIGFCDPAAGACAVRPRPEGAACNDGAACTENDVCAEGACIGAPVDCGALDSECSVGVCDPTNGACTEAAREDGVPCNDGQRCTDGDVCTAGVCRGEARDCAALDGACSVGTCDEDSGECVPRRAEDGTECDDGAACTTGDACDSGACVGAPVDCGGLDGACVVGRCQADTGECRAVPRDDETPCDDGDRCSNGDRCFGGACVAEAVDCSELDGACVVGACDPETGACGTTAREDGTLCQDGDNCTVADRCVDGECVGEPLDCTGLDGACTTGRCDPDTGRCVQDETEDGTACDDGQACTDGDVCADGRCIGEGLDCRDLNGPCVVGQCDADEGECVAVTLDDGTACDDLDPCTVMDRCEAGACAGTPRDCSDLDGACVTGVCDPENGACTAALAEDGAACEDGDGCTLTGVCAGGFCDAPLKDCSDLDGPCAVGICDPFEDPDDNCIAEALENGRACEIDDLCQEQTSWRRIAGGVPRRGQPLPRGAVRSGDGRLRLRRGRGRHRVQRRPLLHRQRPVYWRRLRRPGPQLQCRERLQRRVLRRGSGQLPCAGPPEWHDVQRRPVLHRRRRLRRGDLPRGRRAGLPGRQQWLSHRLLQRAAERLRHAPPGRRPGMPRR